MKKICIKIFTIIICVTLFNSAYAIDQINEIDVKTNNCKRISNKLFSFAIPKALKGLYIVRKRENGIFIYDKVSKKAGFGGFAFGVKAFKNPSNYAMMPGGRKIGELNDKKNNIYDIVLIHPTDVQYDYINQKSESFDALYSWGDTPAKDIRGVKGSTYYNRRGTLGANLYKDVLKKHVTAIKEKWDSKKLEEENMSYMYNTLTNEDKNLLENIGYTYYDTNGDGIEELIIGEIAENNWQGIIYDMYTMVEREPAHVFSGGSRDRYFICDDSFICNEYSSSANESGWNIYVLVENSTTLLQQVGFKYSSQANQEKPWFLSYDFENNEWENVTEEVFNERKAIFERYERFDFTPLSTLDI